MSFRFLQPAFTQHFKLSRMPLKEVNQQKYSNYGLLRPKCFPTATRRKAFSHILGLQHRSEWETDQAVPVPLKTCGVNNNLPHCCALTVIASLTAVSHCPYTVSHCLYGVPHVCMVCLTSVWCASRLYAVPHVCMVCLTVCIVCLMMPLAGEAGWACLVCTFVECATATACSMCAAKRPNAVKQPAVLDSAPIQLDNTTAQLCTPQAALPSSSTYKKTVVTEWTCGACTFIQTSVSPECDMCGTPARRGQTPLVLAAGARGEENAGGLSSTYSRLSLCCSLSTVLPH